MKKKGWKKILSLAGSFLLIIFLYELIPAIVDRQE